MQPDEQHQWQQRAYHWEDRHGAAALELEVICVERDRLRDQVRVLREVLERYGRHDQECPVIFTESLCTCGLTIARTRSRRRKP